MARTIWKGAISFGLVHIPVSLLPATVERGIDFDWLDRRSMDPVGYKRINKATGEEIDGENIVRGVQYEKHRYVVLSDEEIRAAYPAATQTVDILGFLKAEQIPLRHIDTPYYLAPERRGEKVYALLREALAASGKVGLAKVVLRNKQHLAALMAVDDALVLNTLRWGNEVRSIGEIGLTDATVHAKLESSELEMAKRLIDEMSADWEPGRYQDEFAQKIMELVDRKAREGQLETVGAEEEAPEPAEAELIDLVDLLKRSLGKRGKEAGDKPAPAGRKPDKAPGETASSAAGKPRRAGQAKRG